MRLAICGLTAVLLSGCSWLGMGSGGSSHYGQSAGMYGANCYAGGNTSITTQSYGAGACGAAGGYGVGGAAYGAGTGYGTGFGAGAGGTAYGAGTGYGTGYGVGSGGTAYGAGTGYGTGYGVGAGGTAYGASAGYGSGYGAGAGGASYGAGAGGLGYGSGAGFGGTTTTLGTSAPYGSAFGGATGYSGGQYVTTGANGQILNGSVQTVQGAPIYVPQPYPVAVGGGFQGGGFQGGSFQGGGFGGALPFGLAAGIGASVFAGGDIFPGEVAKSGVSDLTPISYKDAFETGTSYDLGGELDLNHNTTLLARVGYMTAEGGDKIKVGSITQGSVTEDLFAEFSDLEQIRLEGGLRKYVGGGRHGGLRPYVGATGGFVHTDDVQLTQSSATLVDPAVFTQTYVDGGWSPTASGLIGAEWQMGARSAIGVETGIRWTDDLDTNFKSDDTWSIPVQLRGRVAF